MSVSSISPTSPAPTNYNYPGASTQGSAGAATSDSDSSDAGSSQPVQPPLPPGQGTRVNQLA